MLGPFDWQQIGYEMGQVAVAYLLALPIGWERERASHGIGLRTFPLVAMASCGYLLLGQTVTGTSVDAQSRIVQGLITGIGFIGGGAIVKGQEIVYGTATAASIWNTGAIGAAVALGRYEIAVVLSLLNLITLRLLMRLKGRLDKDQNLEPK